METNCEKLPPFLKLVDRIACSHLGDKLTFDISCQGQVIIREGRVITKRQCVELARNIHAFDCEPSPTRNRLLELRARYHADIEEYCEKHFGDL